MNCEECNYYTEEFSTDKRDNVPFCKKLNIETIDNVSCVDFENSLSCFDCDERYEIHYELDDIDHYCKKLKCLIYRQQRSVLYRGDFKQIPNCLMATKI